MKHVSRIMLAAALMLFGAMTAAAPSWAAVASCGGRAQPVCSTEVSEKCVKQSVCGVGFAFAVPHLITCCTELEINTEYTYYAR